MTDSAHRAYFSARALRASLIAGLWTLPFALILFVAIVLLVLGLFPIVEVVFVPQKLLGLPSEGGVLPVTVFWSMVFYLGTLTYVLSTDGEHRNAPEPESAVLGAMMALAFVGGFVYLVTEHRTGAQARELGKLVVDLVQRNEDVMRQAGGKGSVSLHISNTERNGMGRYEVTVRGPKTIYAIVDASEGSPKPHIKLLCTTTVEIGKRAPGANPCAGTP